MKISTSLFKRAAWLVGCVAAWVVAPAGRAQTCGVITNSGFEANLTGWANLANSVIVADAHSGTKAVRMGTGAGGLNSTGTFPVVAGQSITFQVWAKVSGPPSWAGVGIDFLNASGVELSEVSLQITSTAYASRTATQVVPAGATQVRIWTWKSGTSGFLFLDDVCLTTSGPVTPPPPPPPASCGSINNNGFESGLTGWTNDGNTTLSSSARSGSAAIVTGTGPGGVHYAGNIAASAGQSVTFQVWGRLSGAPGWSGAGIDFINAAGTEIGEATVNVTSNVYTQYSVTATAPAGTVRVAMWSWKSGTTGSLFLDDICLTVGGPVGADIQAPSIPAGLRSSNISSTGFTLTWGASTDNVAVTGYEVFRNGTSVGTPAATSFSLTGLTPSTTYTMSARARDAAGNLSAQSGAFLVTTSAASGGADTQPPSVPAGLGSSNVSSTGFTLTWGASTDNIAVTGYQVFRNGTSVGTPSGTSFSLTGLTASTAYTMSVRARDAAGNLSAPSGNLIVTTSAASGGGPFTVTVNKSVRNQTIDGFGFFGGMNVWWGSPTSLWSDVWGDQVISDLGITIWRNEYYPPADAGPGGNQDADWNKQRPVVRGLKAKADQYGVKLKFTFTVWSPPSSMKCGYDNNLVRLTNTTHSTKGGGALNPTKYTEFANYLAAGIQLYKNEGIDLYAFSPQNEPYFSQAFNSCFYKQEWYPQMLKAVIPTVKAAFPNVKVFGSENMLEMEGANHNFPWFYHTQILNDPAARNTVDILAVHGYSDGVAPSSGSLLTQYWTNHKNQFAVPMNKPHWMTETSGYQDSWTANPGAFSLALDMMSGLNNGNMNGWVWWQGSENPSTPGTIGEFVLMHGLNKGKKYYASKQFYRYIRPGAVRVGATSANSNVFVSAFQHSAAGTHTLVVVNTASSAQTITVGGADLPGSFQVFRTSATDNCADVGLYNTGTSLTLPARSIVTLQAGGTPLATTQ